MIRGFFLALLLSTCLIAEENDVYLGVGASRVSFDHKDRFDTLNYYQTYSYNVYGGAIMNEYFSAEINYIRFNDITNEKQSTTYRSSFSSYNIGVLALYPLSEKYLSVYGRFAVGELLWDEHIDEITNSATTATVIVGGGFLMKPLEHLGIRLFYERYSFDLIDLEGTQEDKSDDRLYQMLLENVGVSIEARF